MKAVNTNQRIVMKYSGKFDILLTCRQSKIFPDPIGFSFMQVIGTNLSISMLSVMTKLPNSGLTLSGCKVVEDLVE